METISFARGVPAPQLLPIAELADCAKTAIERDGAAALLYGHTLGYQPLREWIGERHGVDPVRVVVTNGSLQAFHFVLSAFAGAGRVIVERPTYDRPRKILSGFDEVALDDGGLDVDELERLLDGGERPAFLYTIPTFQNPAGVTLSEERRRRLAELASARPLRILEDDPYGLVRFEGEPLPTLFELEGGRNVMYSSSFSKTIAPGLRVGYVIVPEEIATGLEARPGDRRGRHVRSRRGLRRRAELGPSRLQLRLARRDRRGCIAAGWASPCCGGGEPAVAAPRRGLQSRG